MVFKNKCIFICFSTELEWVHNIENIIYIYIFNYVLFLLLNSSFPSAFYKLTYLSYILILLSIFIDNNVVDFIKLLFSTLSRN